MTSVCTAAGATVPPLNTTVAVPPLTVAVYARPLVVVVPELVEPSVIVLPSTTIVSLAPSTRPLTVKVSPVTVWPVSTVLTAAPLNTDTAAACVPAPAASVNVGFAAVALKVGASFTAAMVTVPVRRGADRGPPVPMLPPSFSVTVSARVAPELAGSDDVLRYWSCAAIACTTVEVALLLNVMTRSEAEPPEYVPTTVPP